MKIIFYCLEQGKEVEIRVYNQGEIEIRNIKGE